MLIDQPVKPAKQGADRSKNKQNLCRRPCSVMDDTNKSLTLMLYPIDIVKRYVISFNIK